MAAAERSTSHIAFNKRATVVLFYVIQKNLITAEQKAMIFNDFRSGMFCTKKYYLNITTVTIVYDTYIVRYIH